MDSGFIDVPNVELAPADLSKLTAATSSQNLFGVLNVGNRGIRVDGQNRRIIISDANGVDRAVFGFLSGGF